MRPSKAVRDSVRPFRRWLPWAVLVLPVVIGAQAIEWDARTRGTFGEQAEEVKADIARLRSRDRRRPAFVEPSVPGNAWELHAAALKAVETIVRKPISKPSAPTPAETAWLRATYAPILPLFEEALARETIHLDLAYEKGLRVEPGPRVRMSALANDIGSLARGLHATGEDAEAFRAIVTTLAVLNDLRYDGHLGVVRRSLGDEHALLETCQKLLSSHALGTADLEWLARALDRLVAVRWNLDATVESELVLRRQTVLRDESESNPYFQWDRSWRNLFQVRMARATGLRQMSLAQRGIAGLWALPMHAWPREIARLAAESKFRSIGATLGDVWNVVYHELSVRTRLDLFRAAVATARHREETGEEAAFPELLVPHYLSSMPRSAWTGEELLCREGWVSFREETDSGWTVRRRDDAALSAQR